MSHGVQMVHVGMGYAPLLKRQMDARQLHVEDLLAVDDARMRDRV